MAIMKFKDGNFRFFTAVLPNTCGVFRVRIDRNEHDRALEKGLHNAIEIRKATSIEIDMWKFTHRDYPILFIIPEK